MPENRVSWEKIEFQGEKIEFWAFWQNRVSLETHKKKPAKLNSLSVQAGSKVFDRGGAQPPKRGGAMGVSHGCAP